MASVGTLYLGWRQPGMARAIVIAFAVAGLAALSLLVLLDVMQRRDLDARRKALWFAIGLLSPVGPGAYYVVRRRLGREATPRREKLPSAYRTRDPFHRH